MTDLHTAYVLTGPTASGKTSAAHRIARRHGWSVLSADSMLVYRGMDIGTAKPTLKERGEVTYYGIDLVDPDRDFSTGDYLEALRGQFQAKPPRSPLIAAGGTGLYVRALLEGLSEMPGEEPALRKEAEEVLESGGPAALAARIRALDPERYAALEDRANPRRLVRAYELARQGAPVRRHWRVEHLPVVVGLRPDRETLLKNIAKRVDLMFNAGLIEEVQGLMAERPALSRTARQAIGYSEVMDIITQRMSREQARERMVVRTRRLAKRQMTWLRHQVRAAWIDIGPETRDADVDRRIQEEWEHHGPVRIHI